jgi:mTERF
MQVVMRAPAMLELNVDETLEPRVEFLRSAACVPADSIAKVLVRCPSLLTCTEAQMATRVDFLRRAGVDDAQMAKAVVAFPQVRCAHRSVRRALCALSDAAPSFSQLLPCTDY